MTLVNGGGWAGVVVVVVVVVVGGFDVDEVVESGIGSVVGGTASPRAHAVARRVVARTRTTTGGPLDVAPTDDEAEEEPARRRPDQGEVVTD